MTKLQKAMMAVNGSANSKNSSANLPQRDSLDLIAQELMETHDGLSLDEGRIVAYAYMHKDDKPKTFFGNPRIVPAGYFDSESDHTIFGSLSLPSICRSLADRQYLEAHPSDKGMYRISEEMAAECAEIASRLKGVKR